MPRNLASLEHSKSDTCVVNSQVQGRAGSSERLPVVSPQNSVLSSLSESGEPVMQESVTGTGALDADFPPLPSSPGSAPPSKLASKIRLIDGVVLMNQQKGVSKEISARTEHNSTTNGLHAGSTNRSP